MRAHQAWLRSYLVSGFAVSIAVAAAVSEARAQVDPNLQSTINTFTPPLVQQPPPTPELKVTCHYVPTPFERRAFNITSDTVPVNSATFQDLAVAKMGAEKVRSMVDASFSLNRAAAVGSCPSPSDLKALALGGTVVFSSKPQPTVVKVTFISNPTYETNVFRSNLNIHQDTSLGFGGNMQWTGPVGIPGREFDIMGFSAGSTSVRYTSFPTKSFDAFTIQGFYQFFLKAYEGNGAPLDPKNPKNVPSGQITVDTVAIGLQNQTAFTPTYRFETADLFTPQIVFNRQNISLSDATCLAYSLDPTSASFCNYANFTVTGGQTFSDVPTQENANVAGSVTLGHRFDKTDFVLALVTTATGREYEHVPGGRRDLLLQIGSNLSFNPSRCISASLAVTYNQNYSTLTAAVWNGLVVQPTLNIIFPVEPKPLAGHYCG